MTLAVVLARPDVPEPITPGDGPAPADRLDAHLRTAGARQVLVTGDLTEVADLADRATEPLLLCADDLVAHAAVLRHLATSPVGPTVALVLTDPPTPGQAVLREERGQVVAAGTADRPADPTGVFGGALRVGVEDLPGLAAAARQAATAGPGAAPDRLVTALTRTDTTISAHRVRLLVAHRPDTAAGIAAAEAAIAAVDPDKAELKLSVKEKDDFFTTFFVSTWSPYVTKFCARIGLGPTGVTAWSVLFAVVAAVLFGLGGRLWAVLGAVLLYLGFVLDCVDGQLARYTRRFTPYGGWLDTMADRAKEYVVYAGLAVGVDRAGLGNGWTLAIAAMTLQTARHMTDTWYGALHDEAARRPRTPRQATGGGIGDRLSQASNRVQADTGSVSYWLKRTVVFPIGERWALIALTVALFNPLVSLVAVLVWGGLAAAYTLALRTLRARSMGVPVLARVDTTLYRDDGSLARRLGHTARRLPGPVGALPLAGLGLAAALALLGLALAGPAGGTSRWLVAAAGLLVVAAAGLPAGRAHTGSLDWLVPAALRAAEYVFVIAVDVAVGVPGPITFTLLFVLALHHYDLTARLEKRGAAPLLHGFGLGWDGRLVLLILAVLVGAAELGEALLAGYLFVILVVSALAGWRPAGAGRPPGRAARAATPPVVAAEERTR